ncbi:ATPase, T2SS/T4P/T4SS family [Arthrobacter sp. TMS1-12-1]
MSMDEPDWPPPPPAPSFSDTGLDPAARDILRLASALVVFSGLAATGRSSSQAALIEVARAAFRKDVAIVGDPRGFEYEDLVNLPPIAQYEVGGDVASQAAGVRRALLDSPDLLRIPLLNSADMVDVAVRAATSGTLVFTSLFALSPEQAHLRIIDMMPESSRSELTRALSKVPVVILHHHREAVDAWSTDIPRPTVTMRAWMPCAADPPRLREFLRIRFTRLLAGDRGVGWPVQ